MKKLLIVVATAVLASSAFAGQYFCNDFSFIGVPCHPFPMGTYWDLEVVAGEGVQVIEAEVVDIGGFAQYQCVYAGGGELTFIITNCPPEGQGEGATFTAMVPDDIFNHEYPEGVIEPVTTFCDFPDCGPVDSVIPTEFALANAYPNPFNPTTTIDYSIADPCYVTLTVFNVAGQEVATLVDGEMEVGNFDVTFDAADLASGVYFYKLNAGDFSAIKKMTLIK